MKALSRKAKSLHMRVLLAESRGDLMGIVPAPDERPLVRELEAHGLMSRRPRRLIGERVYRYALTARGRGQA